MTLIGANGAGKSTLMMTIFGNPRARDGAITFAGRDITAMPTHEIARLSHRAVAGRPPHLSAHDRLREPADGRLPRRHGAFRRRISSASALIFPRLRERLHQRGGTLSGGEQQMLAIARALMSRPRLLLLDEPSLGLAPLVVKQIFSVIRDLNEQEGITVFLVEQNAFHALKLAHRGYVMVNGAITLTGTGQELLANPEVAAAYLEGGTAPDDAAGSFSWHLRPGHRGGLRRAWMTGRAAALTWRRSGVAAPYFLPLAFAFRFLYFVFHARALHHLLGDGRQPRFRLRHRLACLPVHQGRP